MYFDTHSHLTLCEKHIGVEDHLRECEEANVRYVLDPGLHPRDFSARWERLNSHANVFLGVAIAPHVSKEVTEEDFDLLEDILKTGRVDALSEIGLEYRKVSDNPHIQCRLLSRQLDLAKVYTLPVFLHIRDAMAEAAEVVRESGVEWGAIHCFTGDQADAKRFLDLGFYLSFSGILTFKNAVSIQEAAAYVPIDRILTETDSPYLAPVPKRGKPNRSSYLPHLHEFFSSLRKMDRGDFDRCIYENARVFFKKKTPRRFSSE